MPDLLIRGLSSAAIAAIDHDASRARLSRNEFLRRTYEERARSQRPMADEDWSKSAARTQDLSDPQVMESAWR